MTFTTTGLTDDGPSLPQLPLLLGHTDDAGHRRRARQAIDASGAPDADTTTDVLAAFVGVLIRYARDNAVTLGVVSDGAQPRGITVDAGPSSTVGALRLRVEAVLRSAVAEPSGDLDATAARLGIPVGDVTTVLRRVVYVHSGPPDAVFDADLVVGIEHHGDGPELVVHGDATLFDQGAIDRMARHVLAVERQLSEAPDTPLADARLLSDGEWEVLEGFNDTAVDYATDVTLVGLFEAQVAATPTAPALITDDGATTSYADLDARANRLAWWLRDHGVTTDTPVGVFAHRSVDMIIALYAILKAGGAYVPLDPDYPDDRLGFMIDEAAMPVIVTTEDLTDRAATLTAATDRDPTITTVDAADDRPTDQPPATAGPDDLAYVIYTSGSTGRPKGVANTHRGICNRLQWMQDHFRLTPDDRVLQKTPFSFDVSVWEFFWPLQIGAPLVIAAPDGHRDAGYLTDTITRHHITTIHFVPSMLRLFLDHPHAATATTLQRVICSGEALTADLRDRFFDHLGCELHNLYGPTEAAVDVTAWQCHPDDTDAIVPIGRPIANTTIHILDPAGHPTPIGIPGELHIGGVQVARGYIARPDLTNDRFIPDPFTTHPAARLYKTGDLARWLPDGTIDFLGRLDFQVKLHGVRIELGEIEATLGTHPNIRDATVTLHTDDRGHQRLVAHVAPRSGHTPPTDLHAHLARHLPEHMVPHLYIPHDALPLTASGKVDRNALAAQSLPATDHGAPPRTPVERFVAGVWAELLGIEHVGVDQRFFELGGNSLQAAEFVNRMQRELGEFIYVVTVFSAPTIAEYAAFLEGQYPDAVRKRFDLPEPDAAQRPRRATARLDEPTLARVGEIVPSLAPFSTWNAGTPNRRAAFILSPPRSGTTLLRVMLAGHPELFAAPELQLLCFDTLDQRTTAFSGRFGAWLEGTIRTFMELDGSDAEQARAAIDARGRAGTTSKDMYAEIQRRIGDRLLIDKSPSYALDPAVLRNAEDGFDEPVYIHLVRDPTSMIRSFENYHMEQILWLDEHDLPPRLLAEAVWTLSHRNIVDLLATVPSQRWLRVRFEDLVSSPDDVMRDVAATLGVTFDQTMVDPYADLDSKMVDGIFDASTPMGDTRLLERRGIDPTAAHRWHDDGGGLELGAPTSALAEEFGYGGLPAGRQGSGADGRRRYASRARARRARSRRDRTS